MQINNVSMQNFGLKLTDRAENFLTKSNSIGNLLELIRLQRLYSDNIKLDIREPLPSTQKKIRGKKPVILYLQWKDEKPKIFRTYEYKPIDIEKHVENFLNQNA